MASVADHHQLLLIVSYCPNGMNGIRGSNSGFVAGRLAQHENQESIKTKCDIEKEGSITR